MIAGVIRCGFFTGVDQKPRRIGSIPPSKRILFDLKTASPKLYDPLVIVLPFSSKRGYDSLKNN